MKRLKIFTAALATSACFASYATAADIYDHGSLKDGPMPAPSVYIWSGFYIGAGIGGMVADYEGGSDSLIDLDGPGIGLALPFGSDIDDDQASVFGTLQIGYDRQLSDRFVIGVFADYDFNDDADTDGDALFPIGLLGDTLGFSASAELDDTWTIGGRFGFLATPATLIYGLVGYTHAELNVSGAFALDIGILPPAIVGFSGEDDLDAITVGVGVETMLRQGLSLKVEYRYTDLDSLSSGAGFLGALPVLTGAGGVDIDTDIHSVRAVLSWRPTY